MSTSNASTAEWAEVTFFEVYRENPAYDGEVVPVFANGKQQCRIVVRFTANDLTHNPVKLTELEIRDHVRLIQYVGGQVIESKEGVWRASPVKNDYTWNESTFPRVASGSTADDPYSKNVASDFPQCIAFYLSTTAVNSERIAAQITSPNGIVLATTNHESTDLPDGGSGGEFHSYVLVKPFTLDSFSLTYGGTTTGELSPINVGDTSYMYRAIEYPLTIHIEGKAVKLRHVYTITGNGDPSPIYKYGQSSDRYRWGIAYFGQPNASRPIRLDKHPVSYVKVSTSRKDDAKTDPHQVTTDIEHLAMHAIDAVERIACCAMRSDGHDTSATDPSRMVSGSPRTNYAVEDMFENCGGVIVNRDSSSVIVGLLVGNRDGSFYDAHDTAVAASSKTDIRIEDEFGNDHYLTLAFDGSDATSLRVTPTDKPTRSNDWQISKATIQIVDSQVYANGRQQARVVISIEATRDGIKVPLTPSEKHSVRLIHYESSIPIPMLDDDDKAGWSTQTDYRGYEYDTFAGAPAHEGFSDGINVLTYYVSAGAGVTGQRLMTGFLIVGDDLSIYRSTGYCRTAGGQEVYYAHMNLGEGHVVVARPTPSYPASDLHLDVDLPLNPIDNASVKLSITHLGRDIPIRSITCAPKGIIHWRSNVGSNPCFTGYANPGDKDYQWNPKLPTGLQPKPELSAPLKESVLVLCGRIDIPREDQLDPPVGPLALTIIDAFGNSLDYRLGFAPNARDQLTIT